MSPASDTRVPTERIRVLRDEPVREDGAYVLYWMIAQRRLRRNHALQRAARIARGVDKPLVILEPVRCGYTHASERLHRFILEGMADHQETLEKRAVRYLPYVEPTPGAGKGLLAALASSACAVVTDDYPCFHVPAMLDAATKLTLHRRKPKTQCRALAEALFELAKDNVDLYDALDELGKAHVKRKYFKP